jgi:DNA repair protein SbcD/Mre11
VLIAHLADLHLGYRAYQRTGPDGVNERERDISDAVGRALGQVAAAEVDLVVVAGDVFHSARPSNAAIMDGFRHFMGLRNRLPGAPIVLVAGSQDAPHASESGSILRLLREIPGVHVVDDGMRTVRLEALDASVLCLPHPAGAGLEPGRSLEPDADAGTNVLLIHGVVVDGGSGMTRLGLTENGGAPIPRAGLDEEAWDYIALGHHHVATRLASNMWYAGSTERVGTDVWAEADAAKGWVLYDTSRGAGAFQELPAREVLDLEPIPGRGPDGRWLDAAVLDARIREAAESVSGGLAGRIVRQVLTDVPRNLLRQLDHERIRILKAAAFHYHLDARPPVARPGDGPPRPRPLEEELSRFLAGWEPTLDGIDRDRLVALGQAYLSAAAEP